VVKKSIVTILSLFFATSLIRAEIVGSQVRAYGVAEQDIGGTKYLIVAGTTTDQNDVEQAMVSRHTSAGDLDTTFGGTSTGYIIPALPINATMSGAKSVAVLSGGTILVAGYAKINGAYQVAVVKLSSAGVVDTGFGVNGWALLSYGEYALAEGIVSYASGSCAIAGSTIVAGRSKILVASFNSSGALNTSFNSVGYYINNETGTHSRATSLVRDSSDNLFVAGSSGGAEQFVVLKLNSSGQKVWLQKTAIGSYSRASDIKIRGSNIIVAGTSTTNNVSFCALACYGINDGNLDSSFGNMSPKNGTAFYSDENFPSLQCNALAIKADGTLYLVCTAYDDNTSVGLACETSSDGSSMSKPVNPIRVGKACGLNDLMIDSGGKVVCCGSVDTSLLLCRYDDAGFDVSFGDKGFVYDPCGMDAPVGSIAYLWEEQSKNTNSSDVSASTGSDRTLNKIAGDGGFVGLGLGSKSFYLKPGTYDITVRAPASCTTQNQSSYAHQIQLMQLATPPTPPTTIASGTSEYVNFDLGANHLFQINSWSTIQTRVTIDKGQGSLFYSIKHNFTGAGVKLGQAANLGPEIYTQVKIVKVR